MFSLFVLPIELDLRGQRLVCAVGLPLRRTASGEKFLSEASLWACNSPSAESSGSDLIFYRAFQQKLQLCIAHHGALLAPAGGTRQ